MKGFLGFEIKVELDPVDYMIISVTTTPEQVPPEDLKKALEMLMTNLEFTFPELEAPHI